MWVFSGDAVSAPPRPTYHVYRLEPSDLSEDMAEYWGGRRPERNGLAAVRENLADQGQSALVEWIEVGAPAAPTAEGKAQVEQTGEGNPAAATVGDANHYLSVATSPPSGFRFGRGEQGRFGIGWHTGSHYDAGTEAAGACRRQGGANCGFNASGTSMRGGCVGLAVATWRVRDADAERTYVVTSSSFRDAIARDLRSRCQGYIFGGKDEGAVVEHSCEIVRVVCAGDSIAADRRSAPRP